MPLTRAIVPMPNDSCGTLSINTGKAYRSGRRSRRGSSTAALQTINGDNNVGSLEHLNQPIEDALVIVRSRLKVFFEDALCIAHGLKG
jgi:hypothetical protein